MKVKRLYFKQSLLLEILVLHYIKWETSKEGLVGVSYNEIYKKLDCTRNELHLISAKLFDDNEIIYYNVSPVEGLCSNKKGLSSYAISKYKKELIKNRNDGIYDVVKWMVSICLVIITIYTTVTNLKLSLETQHNKQEIQELRKELDMAPKPKAFLSPTKTYSAASGSSKK